MSPPHSPTSGRASGAQTPSDRPLAGSRKRAFSRDSAQKGPKVHSRHYFYLLLLSQLLLLLPKGHTNYY
jgi:hypothetical protein